MRTAEPIERAGNRAAIRLDYDLTYWPMLSSPDSSVHERETRAVPLSGQAADFDEDLGGVRDTVTAFDNGPARVVAIFICTVH